MKKLATTTQTAGSGQSSGSSSGSGQTSNQSTNPETSAKTADNAEEAQLVNSEFVALLNADRQALGLSTVSANGTLDSDALESAKNLVSNYTHDVVVRSGANVENIGKGYSSVADIYAAWKASPGHWAAMTGVNLQYISVARCGVYWVYLGYETTGMENYTDESGKVNLEAAVNDGVIEHVTTTDNGTEIYGTTNSEGEGWYVATGEEKNSDDWNF